MRETAGKCEMRKLRRNEYCESAGSLRVSVVFATRYPLPGFLFFSNYLLLFYDQNNARMGLLWRCSR